MEKNIYSQPKSIAILKNVIFFILMMGPLYAMAQQPKMYVKLFAGINASTLVYKVEDVDSDLLVGWQAGGGFRVHKRKAFAEIDFIFFEQGVTFSPTEDDELIIEDDLNIILRGFDIPITIGYVPVKTPLFGWFVYGGLNNWFSMKGRVNYQEQEISFKPKEANLHFYNLGAKFGTQIDVAMLNFDLSYTIGITNNFREKTRTNSHTFALSVGMLF